MVSKEELDFWLNASTAGYGSSAAGGASGRRAVEEVVNAVGGAVSSLPPMGGAGGGGGGQHPPPMQYQQVQQQPWQQTTGVPQQTSGAIGGGASSTHSWNGASRASTPLASGGRMTQRPQQLPSSSVAGPYSDQSHHQYLSSTGEYTTNINNSNMQSTSTFTSASATSSASPTHLQIHHQPKRRQMPDFCYAPSTHVECLLRTTPHLRHLSVASTDMSGVGNYGESRNFFTQFFKGKGGGDATSSEIMGSGGTIDPSSSSNASASAAARTIDYTTSILRQRANRRASLELASFLRILSNEMPHEKFVAVESEVYAKLFSLVHSKTIRADERLAGVAALDALLSVPSFDEEKKAIRFGNNLSHGLKAAYADYEFLHAVARALGRMAMGAANVDRVEFEIGRSLEWLRSDRSDRRLAAVLVLGELARCAPTAFYSKTHNVMPSGNVGGGMAGAVRGDGGVGAISHLAGLGNLGLGGSNEFLDHIFPVLRDPQPIVRVCAADALSECLQILMERQHRNMTASLCTMYSNMMDGLLNSGASRLEVGDKDSVAYANTTAVHSHGSLLVVSSIVNHSRNFILPRFDEVCTAVLSFMDHPMILIRLEVVRLIPKLAQRCPGVYGRRYLEESLDFLISCAATSPPPKGVDMRPTAFSAIGQLAMAMSDEELGGGDISIPTVRIVKTGLEMSILSDEEQDADVKFHLVELKNESDFCARMDDIFCLISDNLRRNNAPNAPKAQMIATSSQCDVLGCFSNMVEALGQQSAAYVPELVEDLFEAGLSEDLIKCLHSIAASLPSEQSTIERRLFEEISSCLAGTKTLDVISNLYSTQRNVRPSLTSFGSASMLVDSSPLETSRPALEKSFMSSMSLSSMNPSMRPKKITQPELEIQDISRAESIARIVPSSLRPNAGVVINTSQKPDVVYKLVLSLRTLRTIGEAYIRAKDESENGNMLLPFLQSVISMYLVHPSSDVRREAAIACCMLLLPFDSRNAEKQAEKGDTLLDYNLGNVSGSLMEEVLQKLLRMAVSDLSPIVRLCVVRGLDERYDSYLCQLNLLPPLFLMLEDEALAVRACALQLLGRLSRLNPAPILPGLRRVLVELIIELRCGGDNSGGREAATRLIVVFLREEALRRLVRPFISSIIDALPLSNVAPRLVSTSLEALGELATVGNSSISMLRQLIPHILKNMQDQNSLKQRVR